MAVSEMHSAEGLPIYISYSYMSYIYVLYIYIYILYRCYMALRPWEVVILAAKKHPQALQHASFL